MIQNINIDYCKNAKVNKCYQYNPLNLKIINAQTDILSNFMSSWSLNGSIVAKLFWRFLKQFEIINSTLEPEGEKLFINNLLNYAYIDIISKKVKNAHKERTDSCAVPAASIIAEHMLSFAVADTILDKFGGDSIKQFKAHLKASAKY